MHSSSIQQLKRETIEVIELEAMARPLSGPRGAKKQKRNWTQLANFARLGKTYKSFRI
jgi:hypothetical protein